MYIYSWTSLDHLGGVEYFGGGIVTTGVQHNPGCLQQIFASFTPPPKSLAGPLSMLANRPRNLAALKLLSQGSLCQTIPSLSLVVRPCPCVAASSVPRWPEATDLVHTFAQRLHGSDWEVTEKWLRRQDITDMGLQPADVGILARTY